MSKTLTVEQVADRLQVSNRTVYEWLKTGDLEGAKIGHKWRIKEEAVEKFFEERTNTAKQ